MSLDPKFLSALSETLADLQNAPQSAIPATALDRLAPFAKPGVNLSIDLEASQVIGAPLVTVQSPGYPGLDLSQLTNRQQQVTQLMAAGKSNKAIARELGISPATVKDHVHAVLTRLGLPSRAALIAAIHGFSQP